MSLEERLRLAGSAVEAQVAARIDMAKLLADLRHRERVASLRLVAVGAGAPTGSVATPADMTDVLRERLTGEHKELLQHLQQLQDLGASHDAESIEDPLLEAGFADAGQATAERVNLLTMVRNLRDALREVDAALERMETGTYGQCQKCGKPITEERLEALPATRLCIACKRAR